jgi:hypothetical protein
MKLIFEDIEIRIVDLSDENGSNYSKKGSIFKKIKSLINKMTNKNIKTKKIVAGFLAALMIFVQSPYSMIIAQTPPAPPEAPVAPTPPPEPERTTEAP